MTDQKELYRAYLSVAVFCEKVLRESDNVLSIIRMVDRINVFGSTPELKSAPAIQLTILIIFKSGILRGKQKIAIRPTSPTGQPMAEMSFPMLFEGDDEHGNALIANMNVTPTEEGLFWFDVYLNEELITRMPLRVAYQQAGFATQPGT